MRLFVAALAVLCAALPAPSRAVTVEGRNFPATLSVDGQELKLVGAGLREKWWVNVYAMGAYSGSGTCDAKALVESEEPKYLRIEMLRDVEAAKMGATIGEAFDEHMPKGASAELRAQRAAFQAYFKEACAKGTVLEFLYVPGQGTSFKQNGKAMGAPMPGRDFARVLWDIYFGPKSCCDGLKAGVLRCGK